MDFFNNKNIFRFDNRNILNLEKNIIKSRNDLRNIVIIYTSLLLDNKFY